MSPRSTVRPIWHSNPHLHLIAQLKGFQTVFGNTVMKRWHHKILKRGPKEGAHNAAKIASAATLMLVTAMLGNELREAIKYGPRGNPKFKGEKWEAKMVRAMDRAGFTGVLQFGIDATYAHRFGSSGVSQIAGPTASQLEHVLKGIGQATEGKPGKIQKEAVSAIPIVNTSPSLRKKTKKGLFGN